MLLSGMAADDRPQVLEARFLGRLALRAAKAEEALLLAPREVEVPGPVRSRIRKSLSAHAVGRIDAAREASLPPCRVPRWVRQLPTYRHTPPRGQRRGVSVVLDRHSASRAQGEREDPERSSQPCSARARE
jgi:hypothetical protein